MAFEGKRQHITQHTHRGRIQRDERIDNVRGLLIILVVIGHFLLPMLGTETRLITGLVYVIYVFHMPLFVMLSGYYAKGIVSDGRFKWGKAVQILWLYFVYESIVFLTEGLAYGFQSFLPNYFRESGAPWYLMSLASWYMTVPLFYRFRGKRSSAVVLIAMTVGICFLRYKLHVGDWFSLDRTVAFLPFFYLGYFSSQSTLDRFLLSPLCKPVKLTALFLVLLVFVGAKELLFRYVLVVYGADYTRYGAEMQDSLWRINLIWYMVAVIISLGIISIMLNRRMLILTDLGKNTLQIYFIHRPIRDLMEYFGFYQKIDPFNRFHVLFLVIFSAILAIVLGSNVISIPFRRLRRVFDPLLEKHHAL